jgi:hypothetical protein
MDLIVQVFIRVDCSVFFSTYVTDRNLSKIRFLHFCIAPILGLPQAGKSST